MLQSDNDEMDVRGSGKERNESLWIYCLQSMIMSKLMKSEHSPLRFDTSHANLNCFIRGKSKPKGWEADCKGLRTRTRKRREGQKAVEFQDKAFLQSVVCKILNDQDCQGITELIDNMVFPSNNSGDNDNNKDPREQLEQQAISQLFCDFPPEHSDKYRILLPSDKQERITTIHSSFNSFSASPREGDSNPELQFSHLVLPLLPVYQYSYYPQPSALYQRQNCQRKRRTVSGEEANEFRIIPEQIEADGRTTVMIRHIPNKYSEEMLLEEIGKVHRVRINFLYLPIDHYNSCNVGYAFANFIHTKFILDFYCDFNGRRWDRYNSQKICELAYARIQGTTNLMDHFHTPAPPTRARSKADERKKSNMELDEQAIQGINHILHTQREEK